MIFTFLFTAAFALVGFFVGLLPDGDALGLVAPSGIVVGYTWANSFLPLTEAFAALGIFVTVYVALLGVQTVRALWRMVPLIGGG